MPAKRNRAKRDNAESEVSADESVTPPPLQIREVLLTNGTLPFSDWVNRLRDYAAKLRIIARLLRLVSTGNLGDHRERIAGDISEMRIDYGPGYRVYYVKQGDVCILLVAGGTKDSQQSDIEEATRLWELCKDDVERISREFSQATEG